MKRILFTGVGRRVELMQAFRQAALALNKPLKLYGADMSETAPALSFCDEARKVCSMKQPEYIDELISICEKDRIDLLIPTIDTDLLLLSENRGRLEATGTRVLISEPAMIRVCRDKNLTSHFFADCGLKAPMPVNDCEKYSGGFPAFIKPKDGSSSINAYRAESMEELRLYARQIEDYVIQPYIDGQEYTIDIFCDFEGNPISIVPRKRLAVRAGEVLKTRICMDAAMIEEVEALVKKFHPCGPITVQCIRDQASGEDYYIEINPRFGGGAPLSMKAGARSAESILKLMDGEPVERVWDISDSAVYSRFDQSVCVFDGRRKIKGVVFDLDDTLYSEKDYVKSGFKAVSDYLGGGYEKKLWRHFEDGKSALDELLKELKQENLKKDVLEVYRSHKPNICLYPDVTELLADLRKRGVKIGVITDGRANGQRNKIEVLGLSRLVDDIIITDELGGEQFRKPCDISFRIIQNRWKIPYGQLVYIGDNPVKDFQAPKQLGMQWIWLNNKNGLYADSQDYFSSDEKIALNIKEIADLLYM